MKIFLRFISYYGPYRRTFAADMFCSLILSAVDLAFPQFLKVLTGGLFTRPANEILAALWWIAAVMVVMYAIRYFCRYFVICYGHIMGAKMERDMRRDLFEQYQRLSFSYYDRHNTGEMMSKLLTDLFDVTELAHHGPETLLISALKIIGSFVILTLMDLPTTMILLFITVMMTLFSYHQNRRMHSTFNENRRKIAIVNTRLQDTLAGIRVVQSFTNEKLEQKKFDRANDEFLASKFANYRVMGDFHAGNSMFSGVLYTAIIVCGGFSIARGGLQPAELAIYALYIGLFMEPVNMLLHFIEQFQRGYTGFKRFVEMMDERPDITDSPGAVPLQLGPGRITFDRVSFAYEPDRMVLQDIDLDIAPGSTVALVGPSGAGKTTLCSLIPRFYDAASGTIRIDGQDIRDVTLNSLRQAVGVVQQDVYIFGATLRENIAYGRGDATDDEIIEAARSAGLHDFISSLPDGYDTVAGERGARLSGGEKQRISIARMFLKNPRLLILDEATSALDNENERLIQQALERLSAGRTTLIIAHRLSTIRRADRIIVIDDRGIAESGTHDELIARNGIYARYTALQGE